MIVRALCEHVWIAVLGSVNLFPNLEAALKGVFNRVLTKLQLIDNKMGDDCFFVVQDAVKGRIGFVLGLIMCKHCEHVWKDVHLYRCVSCDRARKGSGKPKPRPITERHAKPTHLVFIRDLCVMELQSAGTSCTACSTGSTGPSRR